MKLTAIKILADENVSSKVVVYLRNIGFDVLDIKEQHWFGKADADLLQIAYAEQRFALKNEIGDQKIGVVLARANDSRQIVRSAISSGVAL